MRGTWTGEPERLPGVMAGVLACFRDVAGLWPLRTVDNLEFHGLFFLECPKFLTLNRGEVNEDVAAGIALDEAETLPVVESFDLTDDAHRAVPQIE